MLEATCGSHSITRLHPAYVSLQRRDSIDERLLRTVAVAAGWLLLDAAKLTATFAGADDRSALLAAVRASERVFRDVTDCCVPRVMQSFDVFLHVDVLGRFWFNVTLCLTRVVDLDSAALIASFTGAFRNTLLKLLRAVNSQGPGLAVCLYWYAWVSHITELSSCSSDTGGAAASASVGSTTAVVRSPFNEQTRRLLEQALDVANRRHEVPLAKRIRSDLDSFAACLAVVLG